MDELEAVASGLTLAKKVLIAYADDDQAAALRALNDAPDHTARWAASYLASAVREVVVQHEKGKRALVQRTLRRLAANADNNILETQTALMALMAQGDAHG